MERQVLPETFINMIHLACTKGNFGDWNFYSTVMKARDIVKGNRIITVAESTELYSQNINKILQREIKTSRIKSITDYILKNNERFLGCIVVAIHKGNPKWTDVGIGRNFQIDGSEIDDLSIDFLSSKFGVLTLSGSEQIFALDGQHRLIGLRKAVSKDPKLGEIEIPIIFVIHNHELLEKTRRVFTVLNKYAEKPKGAELIILDEDDAAAIVTRKLVSEHPILSKPNALSRSKSGNIPSTDVSSLTTLVTVHSINKTLFIKKPDFYSIRPNDAELDLLYAKACDFWNTIFEVFPEIVDYIDGNVNVTINNSLVARDSEEGGNLLLRPVGQKLLAFAYSRFESSEKQLFKSRIRQVDFSLSGNTWKYLFWNEKMISGENKLKKNLLMFLIGKYNNPQEIHSEMSRVYGLNNEVYKNHLSTVEDKN